jgi:hypothetical protein
LPVPVSRNRFAVPLCVFIFGMVAFVSIRIAARRWARSSNQPRHAPGLYCRPGDATG